MTSLPWTGCPRCDVAVGGSLSYAVGVMMAARFHARATGNPTLAAELQAAYTELLLLLTPPAAVGGERRAA